MASGFGTLRRNGGTVTLECNFGSISFRILKVKGTGAKPVIRLNGQGQPATVTREGEIATLELAQPLTISAGQSCAIG